jgi:26S proteasome regulatory subunit N6
MGSPDVSMEVDAARPEEEKTDEMLQEEEEMRDPDRDRLDEADAIADAKPQEAIDTYNSILNGPVDEWGRLRRAQELAIFRLSTRYAKLQQGDKLVQLLNELRPRFSQIPKAKTAKIVRTVIDRLGEVANTADQQISLCEEYIEWCRTERRAFLRQRIQTKLAGLLLKRGSYQAALTLLGELQTEVKKLDDKQLLVEIFLAESWVHHALRNIPKAKASLTAGRSAASSIYVGPAMQAEIDLQGGKLNTDEKDYRTGYSYFFEAFEGLTNLEDPRATSALTYMLLCKVMSGNGDEVPAILNSKRAVKFSGVEVDAMRAVAKSAKDRSLKAFDMALKNYTPQLEGDVLIGRHLKDLQATLLETNLCRIIEPFSKVEISRVAQLIDMPVASVETKLSQMILDKKFRGILDQGSGQLIIFDEEPQDKVYNYSLQGLQNMSAVVDSLFRRASHLSA